MPLVGNELALRVAAYRYDNAGYMDAISTPAESDPIRENIAAAVGKKLLLEEDHNSSDIDGLRASLLWRPMDNLSTTLMVGVQETELHGDGLSLREAGMTDYQNMTFGGNFSRTDSDYANFLVEYELGSVAITSSTSWNDFSQNIGTHNISFQLNDSFGAAFAVTNFEADVFSQEIRLASLPEGPWNYLVGVMYEDVQTFTDFPITWDGSNIAAIPDFDQPAGAVRLLFDGEGLTDYQQKAFFGELSYAIDEHWELTVGGRHFDYERVDKTLGSDGAQFTIPESELSADARGQTYKANISFTPNDDVLIYGQWSEGFRLGRGQSAPPKSICDLNDDDILDGTQGRFTDTIEPDTTENFELGAKFTLLENRLNISAALFRIEWEGLPTTFTAPAISNVCAVTNNVGTARSQGVEWAMDYVLNESFLLNLTGAYIEAEVTDDPVVPENEGKTLSYAPRINVGLGLEYAFDIDGYPGFVRADTNYLGEHYTKHGENGVPVGDYINIDLRAGIDINQWSVALYAKKSY